MNPIDLKALDNSLKIVEVGFNRVRRNEKDKGIDMLNDEENKPLTGDELLANIEANQHMTEAEKKFAKFFYHYKTSPKVNKMSDLELRAHREELIEVIVQGRAQVGAIDDILKDRKPKGVQGFKKSVNTDETTTAAINTLKERQTRLSKKDQVLEQLKKLYEMSGNTDGNKEAEKRLSNQAILDQIETPLKTKEELAKEYNDAHGNQPFHNPFAKKE